MEVASVQVFPSEIYPTKYFYSYIESTNYIYNRSNFICRYFWIDLSEVKHVPAIFGEHGQCLCKCKLQIGK